MFEYRDVMQLANTLYNVAQKFAYLPPERRQSGREIAEFLLSVYFDEKSSTDIGSAFPALNTHQQIPSAQIIGLIQLFRDKQARQVASALDAINIENLRKDLNISTDDIDLLRELQDKGFGLGNIIPRYLQKYIETTPNNSDKDDFLILYNRVRDLNALIDRIRTDRRF